MMPRNGKRRRNISQPKRLLHARRGMIHLADMLRVALPLLPLLAVLANVVKKPNPSPFPRRTNIPAKRLRTQSNAFQMLLQPLKAPVLPPVRHKRFPLHQSVSRYNKY